MNRADGLETLKDLPPAGHTLLLLGSRAGMTPTQARRLLAWSEQGGHLVLVAERLWDEDEKKSGDLLLDSLDIRQYLTEDFDDSQDQAREQTQADEEVAEEDEAVDTPPADTAEEDAQTPADATPDHSALTRLYLENEQSPAYIGFDPDYHLYDPQNHAYAWANSGDATHLLQMQHGKGLVTVLTDAWIWQNRNIEQYDNAWLLWYLTQDNQVTLLYRAERDSLATLLARHFPEALAAALLLLLGGLWRAGLRQGPLQPVASRSRRQLEEHLRAGADFLLRQRGHVALLHGLQRDILRRARRRHPGFEQLRRRRAMADTRAHDPPATQCHQPGHAPLPGAAAFRCRLHPPGRPPAKPQECPMSEQTPEQPSTAPNPALQRQRASQLAQALRNELQKALIGQGAVIDDVLTALLAGGHVLVEGVPGLGKTLLVRALARCFDGGFARIQFTPDLMPSDVTGHAVYDLASEQFKLRKGPVFTHLLLADEINRAPAKTQAALLEVMQERQVTLEGRALPVPQPFMVLATQNLIEQEGTYPLPEAELDRFMLKLRIDYPAEAEEQTLVRQVTRSARSDMLDVASLRPLLKDKDILALQRIASDLPLDDQVLDYAVRLARTTRNWPGLALGAGPRASIALVRCGRARALLRGGEFVLPDDIKGCALAVLRHRVRLSPELDIEGLSVDQVLQQLLDQVPAPRV